MSKFSRELYDLMEKSFIEENEPIQLSFSNRIYKKYGRDFNKRYDYISGKNNDYIAEKLKNTDITQLGRIVHATEAGVLNSIPNLQYDILNSKNENYLPPQMYVPEEIRKEWVALDTKKYFLNDENKRELLEEYLSTLSEPNRKKAIAVMCENSNSKNYYRFLDLSTTSYSPNQEILSNDMIRYFENKYLNEFIDRQETMQRFNHQNFYKQDNIEKKNSDDEIYRDTVMNKHYYNPYDKNEMLEPKISENREFLDNQKKQDELFEIIDKNSSYYLKQQTEFSNDHLDVRNIRRANDGVIKNYNLNKQENISVNNNINNNPIYIEENLKRDLPSMVYSTGDDLNNSFIVEIPKVDNIADFIEKRQILNYQNTLRKHHNINKTLDFNNEIANTNFIYNGINNFAKQKNYSSPSQQPNMHEQMGSVYETNLNENMMNKASTMQVAQQNIQEKSNVNFYNQKAINNANIVDNNQNPKPKMIKINRDNNGYSIDQLDPNHNNRIEQVRENAFAQNRVISPNNQYLENRFSGINLSKNDQKEEISKINISANALRVAEMNRIQDFFNNKPAVVKTSRRTEEKTLEISEELPKARKSQGRINKKQKQKSSKNEIALKSIKFNRAVVNNTSKENKQINANKEAKRVLA